MNWDLTIDYSPYQRVVDNPMSQVLRCIGCSIKASLIRVPSEGPWLPSRQQWQRCLFCALRVLWSVRILQCWVFFLLQEFLLLSAVWVMTDWWRGIASWGRTHCFLLAFTCSLYFLVLLGKIKSLYIKRCGTCSQSFIGCGRALVDLCWWFWRVWRHTKKLEQRCLMRHGGLFISTHTLRLHFRLCTKYSMVLCLLGIR